MNHELLHRIGKVELHCHLDGSLSLACIRQLAEMANCPMPASDDELRDLVSVSGKVDSLLDYLLVFDRILPLLQTKEALRLAAYDVVEQAAKENVIYMEIRFAPHLSTQGGLTLVEVMEAVLDGINQASQEFDTIAKVLVCGLKQASQEEMLSVFQELVVFANRGLVGFDFAGNEADFPTESLKDLLLEVQELGLPLTLHAGECGCVQNVLQAKELGIKRIGHGTALSQDVSAISQIVEDGVTIELCLTSNLQTGAAKSLEDFPYLPLRKAGARMTINTDNRTVSNTTLTKEYQLFEEYFGAKLDDFYRCNRYAIEASFTSEEEKEQLLQRLAASYPLP